MIPFTISRIGVHHQQNTQLATYLYPLLNKPLLNQQNVYQTYEKISDWYDEHRSRELFEQPYFDKVISLVKPPSAILDLGCGTGEPIARYFLNFGVHYH